MTTAPLRQYTRTMPEHVRSVEEISAAHASLNLPVLFERILSNFSQSREPNCAPDIQLGTEVESCVDQLRGMRQELTPQMELAAQQDCGASAPCTLVTGICRAVWVDSALLSALVGQTNELCACAANASSIVHHSHLGEDACVMDVLRALLICIAASNECAADLSQLLQQESSPPEDAEPTLTAEHFATLLTKLLYSEDIKGMEETLAFATTTFTDVASLSLAAVSHAFVALTYPLRKSLMLSCAAAFRGSDTFSDQAMKPKFFW